MKPHQYKYNLINEDMRHLLDMVTMRCVINEVIKYTPLDIVTIK